MKWTGYSHQWMYDAAQHLRNKCMASCHTPEEVERANKRGWRSFRTSSNIEDKLPSEILCPASKEAGQRTTCMRCKLCDGSKGERDKRKNIFIVMH